MNKTAAQTKNIDAKGRLTLGQSFANSTVIVEENSNGDVLIRRARVIPEREAWLFDNAEALTSVRRGVTQARNGTFAKRGPNLKAAGDLAHQLADD